MDSIFETEPLCKELAEGSAVNYVGEDLWLSWDRGLCGRRGWGGGRSISVFASVAEEGERFYTQREAESDGQQRLMPCGVEHETEGEDLA